MRNPIKLLFQFTLALAVCLPPVGRADDAHPNPGGGRRGGGGPPAGVYKSIVRPNWFANDSKFWYRNALRGGASEFVLVDAEKGIRQAAFDHDKLAAALSKAAGQEFKGDHLPFTNIEFSDDGKIDQVRRGRQILELRSEFVSMHRASGAGKERLAGSGQGRRPSPRLASRTLPMPPTCWTLRPLTMNLIPRRNNKIKPKDQAEAAGVDAAAGAGSVAAAADRRMESGL